MAGREFSAHQRKIINRYYEHLDTITIQKLSEIVTELYLCTDSKKAEKLWQRVEKAIGKTDANPAEVRKILSDRDVQGLAQLLNTLSVSDQKPKR